MFDDDDRIPECDYCDDDSGRCDKYPELDGDEERYFSLTLRWRFEYVMVCNFIDMFFLFKHPSLKFLF